MTIEEKAKAYDEVLNKLRHFITKGVDPLITRADVQDFFPELVESENEKVRKALIDFFGKGAKYGGQTNGVYDKDILAWLERQGEHANFRNKIQVGDKVTRNEDGYLVNLSQLNRVAKAEERQGEQNFEMKSAEESIGISSYEYNKIVDECIFGEQKPEENKGNIGGISANWSEEDERLCQCLIEDQEEFLDRVSNDKYGHSEIISDLKEMYHERIDWLKSLKQRIQKGE